MPEFKFLYVQTDGTVINEEGDNINSLEDPDDEPMLEVETLTNFTKYSTAIHLSTDMVVDEAPDVSSSSEKLVVDYHIEKLYTVAEAGRIHNVPEKSAQRWIRNFKKTGQIEPNDVIHGPPPILGEEHKTFVINFIDDAPTKRVDDVLNALVTHFEDLSIQRTAVHDFMTNDCKLTFKKVSLHSEARNSPETIQKRLEWAKKWLATDMDFVMNCVFIDESAFSINLRRTYGYAPAGKKAIVETKSTRAKTHTILGAISAAGVVQVSIRKPPVKKKDQSKKRKLVDGASTTVKRSGACTHHYICFLEDVMNVMDNHIQFQNYYIVMDNAPIHQSKEIEELITSRGYRYIYLPPYSPELYPIEQFWLVVKSHVRRDELKSEDGLSDRIAVACNKIPYDHLYRFINYSVGKFDVCLHGKPI
ncbi:hypothetical protein RMCBS344292_13743 [Rhizopus microsporus]|nr:hypothetical protein RMCBS344292_13743 [Rhizopus microsporus]